MSSAIPVLGGKLKWSTQTTGHTAIAEAKAIFFPELSVDFADITNLDSAGGYEEVLPTIKRVGESTVDLNYTDGVFEDALGYFANDTMIYFQTVLALASGQTVSATMAWTGYVRPIVSVNEVSGALTMQLAIRGTGAPTFTAGS